MLAWGTPISCSYVSDRVDPALTWNSRWNRKPSMKVDRRPRKLGREDQIPHHVFTRCRKLFIQMKENGNNVLLLGKSLTNVTIKTN